MQYREIMCGASVRWKVHSGLHLPQGHPHPSDRVWVSGESFRHESSIRRHRLFQRQPNGTDNLPFTIRTFFKCKFEFSRIQPLLPVSTVLLALRLWALFSPTMSLLRGTTGESVIGAWWLCLWENYSYAHFWMLSLQEKQMLSVKETGLQDNYIICRFNQTARSSASDVFSLDSQPYTLFFARGSANPDCKETINYKLIIIED